MKLIAILLCIFSTLIQCTVTNSEPTNNEKSPDKQKDKFAETVENVANALGNPELAAGIELIRNVVKTESSTTIGEVHNSKVAFYEFRSSFDSSSGVTSYNRLGALFNFWFNSKLFNNVPTFYKEVLSYAIQEYAFQLKGAPYMEQMYSINFQDGKGTIFALVITLKQYKLDPDGVVWSKKMLIGGFIPAQEWVVITHSESNFFSSDRTDEIIMLPPQMKVGHIEAFLKTDRGMRMLENFHDSLDGDDS